MNRRHNNSPCERAAAGLAERSCVNNVTQNSSAWGSISSSQQVGGGVVAAAAAAAVLWS